LRLSTKYIVPILRIRALNQILTAYPATLEEFQSLLENPGASRIEAFDGMEVAVVNLGEELDIPRLLPTAYYKLVSQQDDRFSLEGVVNPSTPNAAPAVLSYQAMKRCMIGRDLLRRETVRGIYGFVFNVCPHHISTCNCARMIALREIDDGLLAKTLGAFHGVMVDMKSLCSNCQKSFSAEYPRLREIVWERLPNYFGLQDWGLPPQEDD